MLTGLFAMTLAHAAPPPGRAEAERVYAELAAVIDQEALASLQAEAGALAESAADSPCRVASSAIVSSMDLPPDPTLRFWPADVPEACLDEEGRAHGVYTGLRDASPPWARLEAQRFEHGLPVGPWVELFPDSAVIDIACTRDERGHLALCWETGNHTLGPGVVTQIMPERGAVLMLQLGTGLLSGSQGKAGRSVRLEPYGLQDMPITDPLSVRVSGRDHHRAWVALDEACHGPRRRPVGGWRLVAWTAGPLPDAADDWEVGPVESGVQVARCGSRWLQRVAFEDGLPQGEFLFYWRAEVQRRARWRRMHLDGERAHSRRVFLRLYQGSTPWVCGNARDREGPSVGGYDLLDDVLELHEPEGYGALARW